jgi:hypothetical protein
MSQPIAEATGERWLSVLHPDDREGTMTTRMADAPRRPSAPETIASGSADGTPGPGLSPPTTPQIVSTSLYEPGAFA